MFLKYSPGIIRSTFKEIIETDQQGLLFSSPHKWQSPFVFPTESPLLENFFFSHRLALVCMLKRRREVQVLNFKSIDSQDESLAMGPDTKQGTPLCATLIQRDINKSPVPVAIVSWLTIDEFRWHPSSSVPSDLSYGLILNYPNAIVFYVLMILGNSSALDFLNPEHESIWVLAQKFFRQEFEKLTETEILEQRIFAKGRTQKIRDQLARQAT